MATRLLSLHPTCLGTRLGYALEQGLGPILQHRAYVSVTFHKASSLSTNKTPTIDRSLGYLESTFAGTPSSQIDSVGQDTAAVDSTKPSFDIISSGVGSALLVKLPPDTEITAAMGSAVASSSKVLSALTLEGGAIKATSKALLGDALFYQKFTTQQRGGDVLLAPQRMGDIAIVELGSSAKYCLRRDAFLAKTEKVTLSLGMEKSQGRTLGLSSAVMHTVTGPGTLAITHYGGLYRFSLSAGEEYLANPRNLVLWERRTSPVQCHPAPRLIPSPHSPLRKYTLVRHVAESPSFQAKLQTLRKMTQSVRAFVMGTPDFVRLKGPGDFYVASRVESRWEKSRLMNALAAVNNSAAQLFEHSTTFPHLKETLVHQSKAVSPHPGYATHKTAPGEVTYYAQVVGSEKKVVFTPSTASDQ
ncbi:mitochondrial biogenesis AIM24-domain-containing protein [Spinellus fusiger]|nr:mitochondrial biogenesis AIM24-domain-containing protein [Spinellus fusiger]